MEWTSTSLAGLSFEPGKNVSPVVIRFPLKPTRDNNKYSATGKCRDPSCKPRTGHQPCSAWPLSRAAPFVMPAIQVNGSHESKPPVRTSLANAGTCPQKTYCNSHTFLVSFLGIPFNQLEKGILSSPNEASTGVIS